jgi:hypothetical protein
MSTAARRMEQAEGSERRSRTRFPVITDLRYSGSSRARRVYTGCGRTVNISSGGLLFQSSDPPPLGERLKLAVLWPVDLHPQVGLKLVATGRVVRKNGFYVAVEFLRHEFHTRSLKPAISETRTGTGSVVATRLDPDRVSCGS